MKFFFILILLYFPLYFSSLFHQKRKSLSIIHYKDHKKNPKHSLFIDLNPLNRYRFKQSPIMISQNENINIQEDIGSGPVFKKGWLKYLIITHN